MTGPFLYLLHLLTYAFGLMCLLRFLAQLMYVDPTNALVGVLVKFTDPLLKPIRAIIPRSARVDMASVLVTFIAFTISETLNQVMYQQEIVALKLAILAICLLLQTTIFTFFAAIIAAAVTSWFSTTSQHPALKLAQQISGRLTAPVRRFLPALGPMDFSPAVVMIILLFLNNTVVGGLRAFSMTLG